MRKEFMFFTYLIESYARHKDLMASEVLKILDDKNLTNFVFDMYEMYHTETIENAFTDLDSLIDTGKVAW